MLPSKAFSTFFRWLNVPRDQGNSAVHVHSLTHWCILFYSMCTSIFCQIRHACACTDLFVRSWCTFSFILHQGKLFSTIEPTLSGHSKTVGMCCWMVPVMSQHAVIFGMRLFKAHRVLALVVRHQ